MKNILDELYYSLEPLPLNYSQAFTKKLNLSEKISEHLDEEGKKLFFEYETAEGDYLSEISLINFKRGYGYGCRHIFETMLRESINL
ncbi:MAG: hypothetical protein FWH08_02320 [Oscillospiraceae bacterium]|nr:hypothetical protein [Oscillospiraceae bacterium]